jgi:hypothetical protein
LTGTPKRVTVPDDPVLLNNQADGLRKEGKQKEAAALFAQAVRIAEQGVVSPRTTASIYSNYGLLLVSLGRYDEAVAYQRKALGLDQKTGSERDLAFSHHNLGFALTVSGSVEEGITHLEKAREIRDSIGDYGELILTYEGLSNAYLSSGKTGEARRSAEQGLSLQKHLGRSASLRGVLSLLARCAAKEGKWDEACARIVESVAFLEDMRARYRDFDSLDRYDERFNKHYLTAIEIMLEAGRYREALVLIDRTRFRSGCDVLGGFGKFGSPLEGRALELPTVRKRELVLVEWIYPKFDWSFSITFDARGFVPRKIATSEREGPPRTTLDWPAHFRSTLAQTQRVIDAYARELEGVDRLTMMPHGTQWQTPFAALKHPVTGRRLYDTHSLVLCPSLRYCRITDSRPRKNPGRHLVLGDPDGTLPYARLEAATVAEILRSRLLTRTEAGKKAFLEILGGTDYDVVHVACHGGYTSHGMHALKLADGLVTDQELLKMRVSANVVNLAACWSTMTDFSVWNELGGFVRALLIAGARNVIGSVYPLADRMVCEFNQALYRAYAAGQHDAVAAFATAVSSMPEDESPMGWGGLFIVGQR